MAATFSPEEITEMGKMWGEHLLSRLSVEERLAGLKPEEVLRNYTPEEIERYLRQLKEHASEYKLTREP